MSELLFGLIIILVGAVIYVLLMDNKPATVFNVECFFVPDVLFPAGCAMLRYYFFRVSPRLHPLWEHYALSLVSLADQKGLPPAVKQRPDYTHEILIVAFDPMAEPQPYDIHTHRLLTPPNYVYQFRAESDDRASALADAAARALKSGRLLFEVAGIEGGKQYNDSLMESFVY